MRFEKVCNGRRVTTLLVGNKSYTTSKRLKPRKTDTIFDLLGVKKL